MKSLVLLPTDGGVAKRRPPFFRTKKLAIVGATLSAMQTPWHDPSWTIIAHPCARRYFKREPDWYFDLHRPECFRTERKGWNEHYYTWLKTLQTPIFMQKDWPDIPASVRYPLERIEAEFRSTATGRLVATNHAAYMIALAMTEGVEQIALCGCQYSAESEHGVQRESLVYWMGRFEQAGGRLVVPQPNNLLRVPQGLYGYDSHDAHGKLVEEYRAKTPPSVPDAHRMRQVLVEPESVPLMAPPPGVEIAWERSGYARSA